MPELCDSEAGKLFVLQRRIYEIMERRRKELSKRDDVETAILAASWADNLVPDKRQCWLTYQLEGCFITGTRVAWMFAIYMYPQSWQLMGWVTDTEGNSWLDTQDDEVQVESTNLDDFTRECLHHLERTLAVEPKLPGL